MKFFTWVWVKVITGQSRIFTVFNAWYARGKFQTCLMNINEKPNKSSLYQSRNRDGKYLRESFRNHISVLSVTGSKSTPTTDKFRDLFKHLMISFFALLYSSHYDRPTRLYILYEIWQKVPLLSRAFPHSALRREGESKGGGGGNRAHPPQGSTELRNKN